MINDGVYDRYLRLFNKSLDEPGRKDQFLNLYKIYMDIKDTEFMRKMNRYRLLKILKNNGVLFKTRKLGNKPKPITKIRISGLFQVDVKVTHIGDLKYHEVGYWMAIVEVEHGLIYRHFQTHKPTGLGHVVFLNRALAFFKNTYQIEMISIQMDNAPEYAKSHNAYEKVIHDEFVKSVGDWCILNKIKHLNIKKGRKESNGKIENSNKFIDYELLPLIHRVQAITDIQNICKEYDWLHNNLIRRTIRRVIDGTLQKLVVTPIEWLRATNNMVWIKKLVRQNDSCYYAVN